MQRECPSCRKTVPPGMHGIRLECSHWVHTRCLDKKNPDFEQCAACRGDVDLNVPLVDVTEPQCIDGRDYVQEPLESNSRLTPQVQQWLSEKRPIEWIIRDRNHGLQRLLQSGVTLEDFLKAGYTWQQLRAFKDFAPETSPARSREALFALKCNAEHFRDYPHLLGSIITDLQITGRQLVELYGFYFPDETQPLSVVGGKNDKYWNASHLVAMGMKMQDLFGAGMETIEQYTHLEPSDEDARKLGTTDEDLRVLERPAPVVATVHQPQVVYVESHQPPQVVVEPYIVRVPTVVRDRPKMTKLHGLKPRRK